MGNQLARFIVIVAALNFGWRAFHPDMPRDFYIQSNPVDLADLRAIFMPGFGALLVPIGLLGLAIGVEALWRVARAVEVQRSGE